MRIAGVPGNRLHAEAVSKVHHQRRQEIGRGAVLPNRKHNDTQNVFTDTRLRPPGQADQRQVLARKLQAITRVRGEHRQRDEAQPRILDAL